jgi:hypothetical protein
MKNIKTYILLFALGSFMISCSNYTDGINENPNAFTSAPGNLIIGQAQLEVVKLSGSNSSRFSGIFTDQFTGSDRQYITVDNYDVVAGDFDDAWDDLYSDGATQARLAADEGAKNGDKLLVGVSKIIEALLVGEATALWGDVPYSTAFDYTNNPNPTYDAQADVLATVQKLLDEGISNVGSDASVANVYGSPIFVANGAKWIEVAHSLKARYYLIAKDYSSAYNEAKMGISSANGSLLSSHTSASGSENLYYQFIIYERGGYLTVNGSNMFKLITGQKDRFLDTPGDAERAKVYFEVTPNGDELNTSDGGYFAIDASFPIVSWEETKLIEAEAAARTGADALTPFNEVRAHLATVYGGDFPASSASGDDLIAQILEEKYLTLPGSMQIFHDVRRTDNMIGVPIKGVGHTKIPQRFFYPQVEINANDNFPGLVDLFEPTPVNK